MRSLTPLQKKHLKYWFENNYDGGCKFHLADKIDAQTYKSILEIHPTKIHYQNVNNYLESLVK